MQSQHKHATDKRKIYKTLHRFKRRLQTLDLYKNNNSFPTGFVFINIGHTAKSTSLFRSINIQCLSFRMPTLFKEKFILLK